MHARAGLVSEPDIGYGSLVQRLVQDVRTCVEQLHSHDCDQNETGQ